jgi:hypothetical protein
MGNLAGYSLTRGNRDAAMVPVVISRELAQRGLSKPDANDMLFFSRLCVYVDVLKDLGIQSVAEKNSDFLYRCLDAVTWFGCSTIKADNVELGKSCIQAIVQMGRYARRDQLECFWDSCGITPWDHAKERLTWMMTWVLTLAESDRERWIELFSEAFSRLAGFTVEVELKGNSYTIKESSTPHTQTFLVNQISRTIDYSNVALVKEFTLY